MFAASACLTAAVAISSTRHSPMWPAPELQELASGFPLIEMAEEGKIVSTRSRDSSGLTSAQRQLQFLGGEIAHPLVHEGRLLALLVLGHKGTPYRTEDLDLLAA